MFVDVLYCINVLLTDKVQRSHCTSKAALFVGVLKPFAIHGVVLQIGRKKWDMDSLEVTALKRFR